MSGYGDGGGGGGLGPGRLRRRRRPSGGGGGGDVELARGLGGGGSDNAGAVAGLAAKNQTPHTSSKSKKQPVPAAQPATSSAAVQSLAPWARQMASASAKVWSRAHDLLDAPHAEQPLRGGGMPS